jgi:hypothetical protein
MLAENRRIRDIRWIKREDEDWIKREDEEMLGCYLQVDPVRGSLCNPATDLPNYMKFRQVLKELWAGNLID